MSKEPQIGPAKRQPATKPSALDEFDAPSEPADPAILNIVERMVERRRERLAEKRAHRSRTPGS